jgi:hypothetical protein
MWIKLQIGTLLNLDRVSRIYTQDCEVQYYNSKETEIESESFDTSEQAEARKDELEEMLVGGRKILVVKPEEKTPE